MTKKKQNDGPRNAVFNRLLDRWVAVNPYELLLNAYHAQPLSPCEKGCPFTEKCKTEYLACNNFHRYCSTNGKHIKQTEFPHIPDSQTYIKIFLTDDDDDDVKEVAA